MEINLGGKKQEDKHYCLENDHVLIYVIQDDSCARGTAYEAATKAMRWEMHCNTRNPAVETQGSDSQLFSICSKPATN